MYFKNTGQENGKDGDEEINESDEIKEEEGLDDEYEKMKNK